MNMPLCLLGFRGYGRSEMDEETAKGPGRPSLVGVMGFVGLSFSGPLLIFCFWINWAVVYCHCVSFHFCKDGVMSFFFINI